MKIMIKCTAIARVENGLLKNMKNILSVRYVVSVYHNMLWKIANVDPQMINGQRGQS